MTAAFSQDISVFLSLLYTSDVYPRCCNVLEAYPSQEKAHLTDIRQVRGGESIGKNPIIGGSAEKC